MSSPSLIVVRDDSSMSNSGPGPRSGGPTPRRSDTPAQKLEHLSAYDDAITRNEGPLLVRVEQPSLRRCQRPSDELAGSPAQLLLKLSQTREMLPCWRCQPYRATLS